MRFSFIAALALIGVAAAVPAAAPAGGGGKLAAGAPCTKDGKMGVCQSGICNQQENASQGTCK